MAQDVRRSEERIEEADLGRLVDLAQGALAALFDCNPDRSGVYKDRAFLICLCQGAAQHLVRNDKGIKDFDVWAFFEAHPLMPFPVRWRATPDFGPSRFGRDPDESLSFKGRRVDVLGRSLKLSKGQTGLQAVQAYLERKPTRTAWHLAQQPIVALWPDPHCGEVIWLGDGAFFRALNSRAPD